MPVDVELDNLEAVKMILTRDMNRSKYAFLIEEIKASLIERNSCISHVVRSKNNASHFLANFGRSHAELLCGLDRVLMNSSTLPVMIITLDSFE